MRAARIVLVLTAACGASGRSGKAPMEPAAVEAAVRAEVEAHHEATNSVDVEGYVAHYAAEAIVIGPAPGDVWVGRDAIRGAFERVTGVDASVTSAGARVVVAPDARSAWVADEITYASEGQSVAFRVTELYVEREGAWKVIVAHASVGVPGDLALEISTRTGWTELAAIPAGIAEGADAVYTKAAHDLDRIDDLFASVSDRADALLYVTSPGPAVVGGEAIRKGFAEHAARVVTFARDGELRVGVAPGGRVGWVLANLTMTVKTGTADVAVPTRAMLVYLEEGGDWRVVQAHLSNAVSGEPTSSPAP